MPFLPGINPRKQALLCMVIGCEKKAIYRATAKSQRGYCHAHKARAIAGVVANTDAKQLAYDTGYIGAKFNA